MNLQAIALARVVWLVEIQGVDPKGSTSTPEALKLFASKYSFAKVPQKIEELDFQKGIELSVGKLHNINIDTFTFYGNGVVVDTRSSTRDCQIVLEDFFKTIAQIFGATIRPTRQMLLSHLLFQSDLRLPKVHPIFQLIAEKVGASVSADYHQPVTFEASKFFVGADISQINLEPSPFTIERRNGVPFSASSYFSSAPLGTEDHLDLLTSIEAALTHQQPVTPPPA
jgi:hypothetical protein